MDNAQIQLWQKSISDKLDGFNFGTAPNELYEPIRYILSLGGKKLRPILCVLGTRIFNGDEEQSINASLAIEIFHNFTLMHDDIMDEAPLRRGQATVHEKWNQNVAILSGDVMLVKAYDALLGLSPEKFKPALEKFNICAREVCEGQQFDMNFETRSEVSSDEYINMIRLKTAVLLGFSLELGAIIGGAPEADREILRQFGTEVGIGFQLKDDLLDVFGEQAKVGKQVGGDIISNKKTYLLIKALELATPDQLERLNSWINKTDFDSKEKVKAVTDLYQEIGVEKLTEQLMNQYFQQAFDKLDNLSADKSQLKELIGFTNFLINRDH